MLELVRESTDERVAILLRALGSDLSQQILAALPAARAARIRQAVNELSDADVDPEEIDDVLIEFDRFLRFAMEQLQTAAVGAPGLRLVGADADSTPSPGIAASATGAAGAGAPTDEPAGLPDPTTAAARFEPGDDAVADLNRLQPFQIARALESEQARAAAMVMNQLESNAAASVLALLPEEMRSDVFLQMNRIDSVPPVLVERIVRTTVLNALKVDAPDDDALDADGRAAALLRSLDKASRTQMLDALQAEDPEMADRVRGLLYEFEDLLRLESRSVQKLLGEFDIETLATALQKADPAIVEQVNSNLSRRARERLTEELELASADDDAIEAARKQIAEAMGRLDQAGELKMVG